MQPARVSRRRFLGTSAAATAAGLPACFFTAPTARGAAAADPRGAKTKNDKLTVAAIGVGGRGSTIGHQAGSLGNMIACCDVDQRAAERFAGKYNGKCQVFGDYRKLLDLKEVEAVTIGTPDHWHVKIAIEAMLAGKDVYCETPLTLTIAEGKLVRRAVLQTKRVLQVGTEQRSEFGAMFLKAVAIARSGRLGKRLKAVSSVGGATAGNARRPFKTEPPPQEFDWDVWLGQAPKVDYTPNRRGWNFRWWYDYSGGQVTDWGVHHTDIALWALGGEQTGAVQVEPLNANFVLGRELLRDYLLGKRTIADLPNTYNVATQFSTLITLPNSNTINLVSGPNELLIEGEKGKLRVNRGSLTGKPVDDLNASPRDKQWLDDEVVKLYKGQKPGSHMANFFEAVKHRGTPISDVDSHVHAVNACHMSNIAMLLDRKLKWDAFKQCFVDDIEANDLMSRRQREPYQIKL